MTDSGDTKDDVKIPEGDDGKSIKARFDNGESFMVTVVVSRRVRFRN